MLGPFGLDPDALSAPDATSLVCVISFSVCRYGRCALVVPFMVWRDFLKRDCTQASPGSSLFVWFAIFPMINVRLTYPVGVRLSTINPATAPRCGMRFRFFGVIGMRPGLVDIHP